jgi:hypothetical protein
VGGGEEGLRAVSKKPFQEFMMIAIHSLVNQPNVGVLLYTHFYIYENSINMIGRVAVDYSF